MSIIKVSNLSFVYSEAEILRDLSFEVEPQSFLTVAGPNGAGKSTLLNLLCRTLKPKSGSIRIDSAAIESYSTATLARKVAVVRQEFIPVFGFCVAEVVLMARTQYFDAFGFESKADREIIAEALGVAPGAVSVEREYMRIVQTCGSEFDVLMEWSLEDLMRYAPRNVVEGVRRVREGKVQIVPGHDGVFGKISIVGKQDQEGMIATEQMSLF